MLEVVMMGLFFVFGYVIGFIVGSQTGRLQGIREQSFEDYEWMRLKQLELEQEEAKSAQTSEQDK